MKKLTISTLVLALASVMMAAPQDKKADDKGKAPVADSKDAPKGKAKAKAKKGKAKKDKDKDKETK